jgi:hypothetical protein
VLPGFPRKHVGFEAVELARDAATPGYAHLYEDDHADAMATLGAMAAPRPHDGNVIPLHG